MADDDSNRVATDWQRLCGLPRSPSATSIKEVRGIGLLAGVELIDPSGRVEADRVTERVADDLRDQGVLIGRTGPSNAVLKIRPPLVFDEPHVILLVDSLDRSLGRLGAEGRQ